MKMPPNKCLSELLLSPHVSRHSIQQTAECQQISIRRSYSASPHAAPEQVQGTEGGTRQ